MNELWKKEGKVGERTYVNLAEKARAGYCGDLGSFRLTDWKRMKLCMVVNN